MVDAKKCVEYILSLYFDFVNCGWYLKMHRPIACFQPVLFCLELQLQSDDCATKKSKARLKTVHPETRENYASRMANVCSWSFVGLRAYRRIPSRIHEKLLLAKFQWNWPCPSKFRKQWFPKSTYVRGIVTNDRCFSKGGISPNQYAFEESW